MSRWTLVAGAVLVVGGVTACGPESAPTYTPGPTSATSTSTQGPDPAVADEDTSLPGRYFVGAGTFNTNGSDGNYYGVWFLDDEWAYWGRPKSGAPSCTAVSGSIGATPGKGWGCVHYSYDAGSGALTIGDRSGSYRGGELTVGDWSFERTLLPEVGTRLKVNLINRGYSGMCGMYGGCSTWSTSLALDKDGHFVLAGGSISSFVGGSGSGWAADYPPDEKGTYRIVDGGRIHLDYASGQSEVRTFAERYDGAGRADPADASGDAGVVLGEDRFWRDDG